MAIVLFVCKANRGRSVMSQALFERAAGGRHRAISAGSEAVPDGGPHPQVVEAMRELPFDLRFTLGEHEIHLVHGSPRKVNEYLFEDKPDSLYERLAAAETARTLVFGHTHKPWVREIGGVQFVNCGSVGKPKDGDPRGAFAILAAGDAIPDVHIERVEYDARAVADEVAAAGLPEEFAAKLLIAA